MTRFEKRLKIIFDRTIGDRLRFDHERTTIKERTKTVHHKWEIGPSTPWGSLGLPPSAAGTLYRCVHCGLTATDRYNSGNPGLRAGVIEAGGDPDRCPSAPQEAPSDRKTTTNGRG